MISLPSLEINLDVVVINNFILLDKSDLFLLICSYCRYLHYVVTKNSTVNETNRGLLVETLRSIAEILIWGDQNDSRVFE